MSIFPFQTLRTIIAGTSAIDIDRLQVPDLAAAERFLDSYGFDWDTLDGRKEIEDIRVRAIAFLEEALLEPNEQIPPEFRNQTDVRRLLVAVSAAAARPTRLWSCAILRVMHTVAHASSDLSARFGEQIRAQIMARFTAHVVERDGQKFLGDVPIVDFQERSRKSANSVVMKLLHKPENVAAGIFDRVAFRFVTYDRLGALRVVRTLREQDVIQFANIKPRRSRNTLVDLDRLERLLERDDLSEAEVTAYIETWPYPTAPSQNPFSSMRYHALQFTGRQRVRVPGPGDEELRFFFPFEIQVLDEASYRASRVGDASHAAYKERQRQSCRQRVLGELI